MLILKQFLKSLHFGTFWHGIIGSKLWLRENVGYLTYFTRLDGECSPYASKKDTNRSVRKFYPASYFYRKQTKLDGHDPTIGLFGLAKRQSLHHRPVRNPIVNRLPPTPTKPTCPAAAIGTSRTQRPQIADDTSEAYRGPLFAPQTRQSSNINCYTVGGHFTPVTAFDWNMKQLIDGCESTHR